MKLSTLLSGIIAGTVLLAGFAWFSSSRDGRPMFSSLEWDDKVEVVAGAAHQGPWRMNESEFHYVDDPTVAINEAGDIGIAWADQSAQEIFFQAYGTDGTARFTKPVNVSHHPGIFSWLPRMVMASNKVFILWQEIIFSGGSHGGEILFARSTDGGNTFSPALNLSRTPAGAGKGRLTRQRWDNGSLDLVRGPEGHLYAAWTEYEGPLFISRSLDDGASFSRPRQLAGSDAVPARAPSLAVDSAGIVHIAWAIGEDERADIHYAQSADQGASFSAPRIVRKSSGHSDAPRIVVDRGRAVHLVYADSDPVALQRYNIFYTRLEADQDLFEPPQNISADRSGRFQSMSFPEIALDEDDHLYVIWNFYSAAQYRPQGLGFTFSPDGGATFASPGVVAGTDVLGKGSIGSRQGSLMRRLAVKDAGSLAVVNSTYQAGESSHIWLIRGRVE